MSRVSYSGVQGHGAFKLINANDKTTLFSTIETTNATLRRVPGWSDSSLSAAGKTRLTRCEPTRKTTQKRCSTKVVLASPFIARVHCCEGVILNVSTDGKYAYFTIESAKQVKNPKTLVSCRCLCFVCAVSLLCPLLCLWCAVMYCCSCCVGNPRENPSGSKIVICIGMPTTLDIKCSSAFGFSARSS